MNTNQKLPSDALKRTSPARAVITAAAAVLLVGGLGTTAFAIGPTLRAGLNHPTVTATVAPVDTAPTLSPSELAQVQGIADTQQAKLAADQAAVLLAQQQETARLAAAHQEQVVGGPIKCADGYTANAVDAAGNESNCQKNGPGNQPCVAYDANNNCTQYYKP